MRHFVWNHRATRFAWLTGHIELESVENSGGDVNIVTHSDLIVGDIKASGTGDVYLSASDGNILDDLSHQEIGKFKQEFTKFLQKDHPELFSEMRVSRTLSDENKKNVEEALKKFFNK